ncbi:MAG: hypothetical protein WD960_11385 [Gemmatimonadota bacterium]
MPVNDPPPSPPRRRVGFSHRTAWFAARAVFLSLLAGGCGGELPPTEVDHEGPGPDETLFTEVDCPNFALAATSGVPLDEIAIGTLPSSFDLPAAASISEGETEHAGFAFIRFDVSDGDGELRLVVPLHPVTPMEGGSVRLTVSDGTLACEPVDFTIQPLPAADGELEAVVDLLQEVLAGQAASFEATPDELLATPIDDLSPALWPLAAAQAVLDDPTNEESLRAVAEGAVGGEVLDWIERILARTTLRASLENPPDPIVAGVGPAGVSAIECQPDTIGKDTGALHRCMAAAAAARRAASGLSREVAADIGKAFSAASDLGLPLADVVEAVFSAIFWVIYNEREKAAALYPSQFTSMSIKVDRDSFLEDEDEQGRVSEAEVTATSDGYDLQKEIIDGIKEAASLAQTTGKFDFSTGTPVDDAAGQLASVIEERLRAMDIEELDIEPELFGPVDVTDPMWIQARPVHPDVIEVVEGTTYEPRRWGDAILSVRTADGKFGGEQISQQVEIAVTPLLVTISPSDTTVAARDPDDLQIVTFRVEVEGSVYPDSIDLDLSDEHPRQGSAEIRVQEGSTTHEVDYVAPTNPDFDTPDLVVVEHTARTGARKNGPARTATATIRFASITISPRPECLEVGAELQFEAEVKGLEDETVTWTASAGDIDETGFFTAPEESPPGGEVTITATSAMEPDVEDQVTIKIGQCEVCFVQITASGGAPGAGQGPGAFTEEGDVLVVGLEGDVAGEVLGDRIQAGFAAPWNGATGSFTVTSGSYANRTTGGWAQYDPTDPDGVLNCESCGGTLTVEEATEEVLIGKFDVTLRTLLPDSNGPPTRTIGTFRAALVTADQADFDPFRACLAEWDGG